MASVNRFAVNKQYNNDKMDVSIIIPAYNEEGRLGKTLERIISYMEEKG
jgi:cellulose synthase/poly-beta-1,6-N-acetylglucosamine synthase-like glycosyltransferase